MQIFRKIAACFAVLIAFFCTLSSGKAQKYAQYHIWLNEPYGTHALETYDMYLPTSAKGETGLVLFVHSGGWISGSKNAYRHDFTFWADKGCAVAAIDYRLLSQAENVGMRDILDDITDALSAIKMTAAEKGADITKVVLSGSSAGGHLSLLYAYACQDEAPVKPVAAVSYCGPTMLWDDDFIFNNEFGNFDPAYMTGLLSMVTKVKITPDTVEAARPELEKYSPIAYVDEDTVPTLLFYGTEDTIVPYHTAVALEEKLTEYGVPHEMITYPESGHGLNDPECNKQARALFVQYVETYLGAVGGKEKTK